MLYKYVAVVKTTRARALLYTISPRSRPWPCYYYQKFSKLYHSQVIMRLTHL